MSDAAEEAPAALSPKVLRSAERALSVGTWMIVSGAVLYSVLTVTPLMAAHTPKHWGWTAPILPIVVDAAVVIVVRLDSVLARMGADGGRWPVTLRWMTGVFTLLLNTGGSLLKRDPVGAGVHAVAPLLLIVTSETGLAYRRAIGKQIDHAARQEAAERERERAERAAAEQARVEAERAERERERAAQAEREQALIAAEQERIRLEGEQQARLEAERTERERLRLEAEREERQAAREAEQEQARAEAERLERERVQQAAAREQERVAREQAEREREQAKRKREQEERDREREKADRERVEREREQAAQDRERRRVERERVERERERAALLSAGPPAERLPEEHALRVVRAAFESGMSTRATAEKCGWSLGWVSKQFAELREASAAVA